MSTEAKVVQLIAEQSGHSATTIKTDDGIVDKLGMDSLDIIKLVMALEEEFEIDITDVESEACTTVADVLALVERKKGGA